MTAADDLRSRKELAAAFRAHRAELAAAFFQAMKEADRTTDVLPGRIAELHEWWQAVFFNIVDLAREWLKRPDRLQQDLFTGWISTLNQPYMHPQEAEVFSSGRILQHAIPRWLAVLATHVSAGALQPLNDGLEELVGPLSRPARKQLRILTIGDCLMYEIVANLAAPCVQAQIGIETVRTGQRIPSLLHKEISDPELGGFDLVFYSPFSYNFAPEYGQINCWNSSLQPRAKFFASLDEMLEDLLPTLRKMAARFACPIYVHNCAALMQTFDAFSGVAKNLMTLRNRSDARRFINQRLSRMLADAALAHRVRLLDEESLRRKTGDFTLGKVIFRGDIFHPTRFSLQLAQGPYMDAIASTALLAGKKVVVCDLDNTLWDGIIGEGPVQHFSERQKTLKALRNRGILLSINSKNDPANVHFTGSQLEADDFVAVRINWEPKAGNMRSILEELNLKEKDFIFIDDRPDELERMQNAFPAMTTLNATDAVTWRWLAHWEQHLPADQLEDRTRLYHERAAREQFLSSSQPDSSHEDELAALGRLELAVKIDFASRSSDLKRAVELVNRTNQFNVCGSRVTLNDLQRGLGVDQWLLTAAARDKFGSMGMVGAMLVKRGAQGLEVPVFVLSCRAFGFGIEYALLNAVSELAPPASRLVGLYQETPHNGPCRDFYARAGLRQEGSGWVGAIADLAPSPSWLAIDMPALTRS